MSGHGRIDAFEAMVARGQDNEMLRFTLGSEYFAAAQYREAADHLRLAVTMKPDYSAAWKMLGRALAESAQPEAALEAFDRGLEAAGTRGDKQTAKEIAVFRRRVLRQLASDTPDRQA